MNCLTGETKWFDFIKEHFESIRAPFTAGMELWPECNFRCIHCHAESERCHGNPSMTTEQIMSVIDMLVERNCIELFLTGGETLLHKDFALIYTYAKKKGLLVSVLTNGSLISQEHIDLWKEYRPEMVSLTMYAATPETYELITRCKTGYTMFCRGVNLLKENNIPFEIKCIGMKQNLKEIPSIREFARSLGLRNAILGWDIRPMNDGSSVPVQYRVSPEEAFEIELQDCERRNFWETFAHAEDRDKPTQRQLGSYQYPCSIARQFVFITHDGYMQGCVKAVSPRYDLMHGDFDSGWDFLEKEFLSKKASLYFRCLSCDKIRYCEQCSAAFAAENGDPETPVEFYCKLGQLRQDFMNKQA